MVEIKSQENNTVKLPNNIRQVGTPGEKIKIYIEDYVITYLRRLAGEETLNSRVACRTEDGASSWRKGAEREYRYLFYQCGNGGGAG